MKYEAGSRNGTKSKITSFIKLDAWKESHKLVLAIYSLTRQFPKEELFVLTSQIRRCSISITSNIAEGFGRQTLKEKVQFYYTAQGSLTELQNQLLLARDIGYITQNEFYGVAKQTTVAQKIINGLIKKTKEHIQTS